MAQMAIGKKIGLSVSAVVGLCIVIGAVSWFSVSALGNRLDQAINSTSRNIELLGELKINVYTFRLQERGMLLFSHIDAPDQVIACRDAYDQAMGKAYEKIQAIRLLTLIQQRRDLLDQAEAGLTEYKSQQMNVRALLAGHKTQEATQWDKDKLVPAGAQIVAEIDKLSELQHQDNLKTAAEASSVRNWAQILVAIGLFACIPIGIAISIVTRRATRQLHDTAIDLDQAAEQVADAAAQVSSASQSLAQGASQQAASLEETSSSTAEVNFMTSKNAQNSSDSARLMGGMEQQIKEGNRTLDDMIASMKEINGSSEKISKIIKVIDEIAFQTNILALNAAVEAARAGEAGMGFAVVADEVRNLAQRCAQAAKDTAGLIEESIHSSHEGGRKLDDVAKAINAITKDAEEVKTLVDEVNLGSQEQARGLDQISKSISQMEQVTQKNAAGAEESAAAGEQLSAQSEALRELVSRLTELVGGASTGRSFTAAPPAKAHFRAASPTRSGHTFNVTPYPAKRTAPSQADWLSDADFPSENNPKAI
jgi:methyl-accepting chemotaxis protein/methyl-accepting chemotaxis protein-1 (serine sensor receptor)